MSPELIGSIISLGLTMSAPVAISSLGEVFSERSGVINLGIDGIMLMSAFVSFHVVFLTGNIPAGYLLGILTGVLLGLLLGLFIVVLRFNQVVAGMGLYFLGLGLSDFLYRVIYANKVVLIPKTTALKVPLLSEIPLIGEAFFNQYPGVYVMFILTGIIYFILYYTRIGLWIRALGENPRACDAAGINVTLYRLLSLVLGSAFAGFAGAVLCLEITGLFYENLTYGMGFIAIGLAYFGKWDPLRSLAGSLIFGITWSIGISLQDVFIKIGMPEMTYFMIMLPYLAVLVSLLIMSKGARPPASLGKPYYRE
ncbi:ABC transporter permease [Infirmifilum sp.]|uniref:ABC transporter permease n=1 Tax=Infirmifilum sp. TaxID=2856575 RepID=UPI003D11C2A4